jgi:hypothetical protein
MGTHMKTTIELNDTLVLRAKTLAAQRQQTLKSILETALRQFLDANIETPAPFKLRKSSFRGNGLQPHLAHADWDAMRSQIYEGRGG